VIRRPVGKMSSADLVAAVTAAGLDDDGDSPAFPEELRAALRESYRERLRVFLAGFGLDALDWLRARRDVRLAEDGLPPRDPR
jgi:hypothetical protein